jgi:hypothetical protein
LNTNENLLSPWKESRNDSEYCRLDDLQEEIRSQLRQENKFTTTIADFRYTVKNYEGRWLVFRRNLDKNAGKVKSSYGYKNYSSRISEIKIIPLNEANGYLQINNSTENCEYQIFGSDPIKVINNEVYVVMVKRNDLIHTSKGELRHEL